MTFVTSASKLHLSSKKTFVKAYCFLLILILIWTKKVRLQNLADLFVSCQSDQNKINIGMLNLLCISDDLNRVLDLFSLTIKWPNLINSILSF